LVEDGQSGFIVEPSAEALAAKFDQLAQDRKMAERMGQKGFQFISRLTWPQAVRKLVII